MHSSSIIARFGASLLVAAGITDATMAIANNYDHTNFFQQFRFEDIADPTKGFVNYVAASDANKLGLAGFTSGTVFLGADSTTMNPSGSGRNSTRMVSNTAYTKGLFVADIAHMPVGCGVWPAFWTVGPNWPHSGEIDIMEGVNNQNFNIATLHTDEGCTMTSTGSAAGSTMGDGGNCLSNSGCPITTTDAQGFGAGFNAIGGGVYAMDWTSSAISVYFFPRNAIPADITSGSPNPAGWGTPQAKFSGPGCSIDSHFKNHNIVFNTDFCGDWAGNTWSSSSCSSLAPTCEQYVAQNPQAFTEAYWMINSVKVYNSTSTTKRDDEPVVARRFKA